MQRPVIGSNPTRVRSERRGAVLVRSRLGRYCSYRVISDRWKGGGWLVVLG
jgi:hypothetical protein